MKEVKEVVHVPTRELAEEVLRAAKENGLMKALYIKDWGVHNEETCFMISERFGFSSINHYQDNECKVISAYEFMYRYKLNEFKELDQLRKENESLKKQLQEIQDQPKVGDVCLFWDGLNKYYSLEILSETTKGKECIYRTHNNDEYANCIKATPENIQAKIKELQDE